MRTAHNDNVSVVGVWTPVASRVGTVGQVCAPSRIPTLGQKMSRSAEPPDACALSSDGLALAPPMLSCLLQICLSARRTRATSTKRPRIRRRRSRPRTASERAAEWQNGVTLDNQHSARCVACRRDQFLHLTSTLPIQRPAPQPLPPPPSRSDYAVACAHICIDNFPDKFYMHVSMPPCVPLHCRI